jgi:hypothetical protein
MSKRRDEDFLFDIYALATGSAPWHRLGNLCQQYIA